MKKPTKEDLEKSIKEAKKLWPESFEGECDDRPNITAKDVEELNRELRRKDRFRAWAVGQTKHTPKKGENHGLSNRKTHQ